MCFLFQEKKEYWKYLWKCPDIKFVCESALLGVVLLAWKFADFFQCSACNVDTRVSSSFQWVFFEIPSWPLQVFPERENIQCCRTVCTLCTFGGCCTFSSTWMLLSHWDETVVGWELKCISEVNDLWSFSCGKETTMGCRVRESNTAERILQNCVKFPLFCEHECGGKKILDLEDFWNGVFIKSFVLTGTR